MDPALEGPQTLLPPPPLLIKAPGTTDAALHALKVEADTRPAEPRAPSYRWHNKGGGGYYYY